MKKTLLVVAAILLSLIIGLISAQATILIVGLVVNVLDITLSVSYESVIPFLLIESLIVFWLCMKFFLKRFSAFLHPKQPT